MAKLSKTALKSIVKECLVEILQEGLMSNTSDVQSLHEKKNISKRARDSQDIQRRIGLDKISMSQDLQPNKDFEKNIENTANQMTSDPVLSSILMDTAKTTLQEQVGADRIGPGGVSLPSSAAGDAAARTASKSNPEDLFSESASKWADLAFAPSQNLK